MNLTELIKKICSYMNWDYEALIGESKEAPLPEQKRFLWKILRSLPYHSFTVKAIGKAFNRDHSTIVQGTNKYDDWFFTEPKTREFYNLHYPIIEEMFKPQIEKNNDARA